MGLIQFFLRVREGIILHEFFKLRPGFAGEQRCRPSVVVPSLLRRIPMLDIVLLALGLVFLGLTVGYGTLCERL